MGAKRAVIPFTAPRRGFTSSRFGLAWDPVFIQARSASKGPPKTLRPLLRPQIDPPLVAEQFRHERRCIAVVHPSKIHRPTPRICPDGAGKPAADRFRSKVCSRPWRNLTVPSEGRRANAQSRPHGWLSGQLTFGVVNELLKPRGMLWNEPRQPGGVDQAQRQHVAKMSAVLVAV
jgi:hypothetical protein